MEIVTVNDKKALDELYGCSALTIEGLHPERAKDLLAWIKNFTKMKREVAYVVSGSLMNMAYGLTGDNAYPESDCDLVCVKLTDMENPMSVALPRFEIGGRWFDDVVDNNARREQENAG